MRKIALGAIAGLLIAAAPAAARWKPVGPASVAQPTCPVGTPVQTITVIDQTGGDVKPIALARVERATIDQSLQVRRWWNTPCVQFAAGGWKLYLKQGAFDSTTGVHYGSPTRILVWTGALNYEMWSALFTHEIVETLVDPAAGGTIYANPDTGAGSIIEVADPVESRTYRLDRVNVTDFVTPNWYAGATLGPCAATLSGVECGPLIASASNAGPWDQARLLSRPWETANL